MESSCHLHPDDGLVPWEFAGCIGHTSSTWESRDIAGRCRGGAHAGCFRLVDNSTPPESGVPMGIAPPEPARYAPPECCTQACTNLGLPFAYACMYACGSPPTYTLCSKFSSRTCPYSINSVLLQPGTMALTGCYMDCIMYLISVKLSIKHGPICHTKHCMLRTPV